MQRDQKGVPIIQVRAEVLNEGRASAKTRCRRITTEEAKQRGQQQVGNDLVGLRINQVFSLPLAAGRRTEMLTKVSGTRQEQASGEREDIPTGTY